MNWPIVAFLLTLVLAFIFSTFSETVLLGVPIWAAVLVLLFIIVVGIAFDVIGISVTYQRLPTFTAMAAKKIRGAKQSIALIQHADRVSNICNDVVGDICGIVSGAMGATISGKLLLFSDSNEIIYNVIISSLIAALTVGGKAVGKHFAMENSQRIVFFVGKFLAFFSRGKRK